MTMQPRADIRTGLRQLARALTNSSLRGAPTYLASNVLAAAIPLLLLPILTRYLSPAEYGETAMFQTVVGAAGALVGLGTVGAAVRKYFDKGATEDVAREFIGACLQVLI